MTETFDYVIAGGGSAGCVLAARLAEDPKVSVCLVEAGGRGREMSSACRQATVLSSAIRNSTGDMPQPRSRSRWPQHLLRPRQSPRRDIDRQWHDLYARRCGRL